MRLRESVRDNRPKVGEDSLREEQLGEGGFGSRSCREWEERNGGEVGLPCEGEEAVPLVECGEKSEEFAVCGRELGGALE